LELNRTATSVRTIDRYAKIGALDDNVDVVLAATWLDLEDLLYLTTACTGRDFTWKGYPGIGPKMPTLRDGIPASSARVGPHSDDIPSLLRRLAARRIVHHHPARAHEVACGALDVEVVHDLGPRVRRDADDGRGARAGRDGVAREKLGGADPAAARCAERLVERDVLGVAAEVEPLAREDEERVAVGGGEGLEIAGTEQELALAPHQCAGHRYALGV
jgi:hypothetical protein